MNELSREIEQKFGSTSRRSAIISLIGAAIVIAGLLFATYGAIIESRKAEAEARLAVERALLAAEQARIAEKERLSAEHLREQLQRQEKAERLVWDGAELAARGLITEAIRLYDSAIELNPKRATALQLRGYALLRRAQITPDAHPTDLADAVASLEKAVSVDPQHTWGYYNLSLAYWEANRREEAVDSLRRLLALDPSFRSVISNDAQFTPFREFKDFVAIIGED